MVKLARLINGSDSDTSTLRALDLPPSPVISSSDASSVACSPSPCLRVDVPHAASHSSASSASSSSSSSSPSADALRSSASAVDANEDDSSSSSDEDEDAASASSAAPYNAADDDVAVAPSIPLRIPLELVHATKPNALLNFTTFERFLDYCLDAVCPDIEGSRMVRRGNNLLNDVEMRQRQLSAQYGRVYPTLVRKMLNETKLGPGSLLVDLGSGVGTICLQASAMTGCKSLGIELMEGRHKVAQTLMTLMELYSEQARFPCGEIELVLGDFTRDEMRARAVQADVLFVNNAHGIFGVRSVQVRRFTLDYVVALVALELKVGAHIICFDPLPELDAYPFKLMFKKTMHRTGRAQCTWTFVSKKSERWFVYERTHAAWTCAMCASVNGALDGHRKPLERCPNCVDDPLAPARHYLLRGRKASQQRQ